MSTRYHVYANNGAGGPIDYTTPIATVTSGTTWLSAALSASSSYRFAVRAFDSVSGLEERNVDAAVSVVLDAGYHDLTYRPNAPGQPSARQLPGGDIAVTWRYTTRGQALPPTGFKVWANTGGSVNYAGTPTAVPYVVGQLAYTLTLTGLTPGSTYHIGIRSTSTATNSGDDQNTVDLTCVSKATGPSDPDSASGVATLSPG